MSQPWDYIAKLVCIGDSGTGKSSLTIRLCEGRFSPSHDVTIGVEFGSRIVPVGPPASLELGLDELKPIPPPAPTSDSASLSTTSPNTATTTTTTTTTTTKYAQSKQQSTDADAATTTTTTTSIGLPSPPRKPQNLPPQKRMKLSLWDTAGQETYKSITRSYFRGASGALLVFDISRRDTFVSCTQWLQDLKQIAEEGIVVILVGNKSDLAGSGSNSSAQVQEQEQEANKRQVTVQEAEEWCRMNNVVRYVETSAKSGDGVERAFLEVAERIYRNIEVGKYDLNDRRSGVKGFGASGGANAGVPRTVTLGMDDAMRKGSGWSGGCC